MMVPTEPQPPTVTKVAHRVMHKYRLDEVSQTILTRSGAKVVLVDHQQHAPTLWLMIDTAAPASTWGIEVFATGEAVPDGYDFLGSVNMRDRGLVWHVFRDRSVS